MDISAFRRNQALRTAASAMGGVPARLRFPSRVRVSVVGSLPMCGRAAQASRLESQGTVAQCPATVVQPPRLRRPSHEALQV